MKKNIHPKYGICSVKCVCGNTFQTKSTVPKIDLGVCGACHPVYTGKKKIVDSTGRVDRYNRILSQKKKKRTPKKESKPEKSRKKIEKKESKKGKTEKKLKSSK